MENAKISFENQSDFHQDQLNVSKQIQEIINRDDTIQPFNDLLLNYCNIPYETKDTTDFITMSDLIPYPQVIIDLITPTVERVYFGVLPYSSFYYCIIDNSILFWSLNVENPEIFQQTENNTKNIFSVTCGAKNPTIFKKIVTSVIVYAFNKSIKIIPVINSKIRFDNEIKIRLSFNVSYVHIDNEGNIFLAGDTGFIYIVKFSTRKYLQTKVEQLTRQSFFSPLLYVLNIDPGQNRRITPIVKLLFDNDTQTFASLHLNSEIRFYEYVKSECKINFLSSLNPSEIDIYSNQTVIDMAVASLESKSSIRFIAFLESGQRIFFIVDAFLHTVEPSYIVRNPPSFNGDVLFSANYFLSYTFFLCEKSLCITKGTYSYYLQENALKESVCNIPFNEDLLGFAINIPNVPNSCMFNNEMFWQHVIPAPSAYLLTNHGIRILSFKTPADKVKEIIENGAKGKLELSVLVRQSFQETFSSLLLLISKNPIYSNSCLLLLKEQSDIVSTMSPMFQSPATTAFLIRISRILHSFWSTPIFLFENDEYKLNDLSGFVNLTKSLQQLYDACKGYTTYLPETKCTFDVKCIPKLKIYIQALIETINLIKILIKLDKNSSLTPAFLKLDVIYQNRLSFFQFSYEPSIFKSLRELLFSYLRIEGTFYEAVLKELDEKCPSYFCKKDLLIFNSIQNIEKSKTITQLNKEFDILYENIEQEFDIERICLLFHQKGFYSAVTKLCLKKAYFYDPNDIAITIYLKNDFNNSRFNEAKHAFSRRRYCYEIIFNEIDYDFDAMINSSDQLFHYFLYTFMFKNNKIQLLMKQNTPFLLDFLMKNGRKHVWMYYYFHKQYGIAAKLLYQLATDKGELLIDDRIDFLNRAVMCSFECASEKEKAVFALKVAKVQKKLSSRETDEIYYSNFLIPTNDLVIELIEIGFWDLILELLDFVPFVNGNFQNVLSSVWNNLLMHQLMGNDIQSSKIFLTNFLLSFDKSSRVRDLRILVPLLETFKVNMKGEILWALNVLSESGFEREEICEAYLELLDHEIDGNVKKELIFCVSKMLPIEGKRDKLCELQKWFLQNAKDEQYFEETNECLLDHI